jgi:hypothetical protein
MKETNFRALAIGVNADGGHSDVVKGMTISLVEYPSRSLARNSSLAHGLDV